MNVQKIAVSLLVVTQLMLGLTLCIRDSNAANEAPTIDIRGIVTSIELPNENGRRMGTLGFLRVEGKREPDTQYDKAIIRITTECKIQRVDGKLCKSAGFDSIRKGSKVEATFIGGVAASDPPQAKARSVLILDKEQP